MVGARVGVAVVEFVDHRNGHDMAIALSSSRRVHADFKMARHRSITIFSCSRIQT